MYARQQSFTIRQPSLADRDGIIALYKKVSRISGGLARAEDEITPEYVSDFIEHARRNGLHFVMVHTPSDTIVGDLHCYKPGLKVFDHLLSDLTIAVDPDFQGRGIGKALFNALFSEVKENRKDIFRIELLTGEPNKKAIAFYQSLGFIIEGRMPHRFKLTPVEIANAQLASNPAVGLPIDVAAADPVDPNFPYAADIPMAWFNPNFQPPK